MNALDMVAKCALHQPVYAVSVCSCGEPKAIEYWQCALCHLRESLTIANRLYPVRKEGPAP